MDDQTRFWIAQQVADTKYTAELPHCSKMERDWQAWLPSTVITDGAFNFSSAIRRAYWRETRTLAVQHVRHVPLSGDLNKNRMESNEWRSTRERKEDHANLKRSDTPNFAAGYQIYHNYVRPHMGLDGKTPAEAAGIEIQGKDK